MMYPQMIRNLKKYSATLEQFADARLSTIEEGTGRGTRIVHVFNGSGLAFTVAPDRAMDLVECSFRGIPIAFRTPVGYAAPARFEPAGLGWLRNWQGGLLTTVGLRNAGGPNGEFGLHGRISNQSAEDFGITRTEEADGTYRITMRGVMRESMMFGENLRMTRTISTAFGCNEIEVSDEVTNLSAAPDVIQFLYHCNFGFPLVSPAMKFSCAPHKVTPRDAHAAEGLKNWDHFDEPTPDFVEQCYFHELPADENGMASISVFNPEIGIRMTMSYPTANLPRLVEWKNSLSGLYVMGLEPTNTTLAGRTEEIARGTHRTIEPGETIRFGVKFAFEGV